MERAVIGTAKISWGYGEKRTVQFELCLLALGGPIDIAGSLKES